MSTDDKTFLDGAYTTGGKAATKNLYENWAATYEKEIRDNGYATPDRCADALASCATDKTAPLLDLGCGTGLSGEAFRARGFSVIDGSDFSEPMMAYAQGKPGLYRKLTLGDLSTPLPASVGDYQNMAAVGVFSPSHAPAPMLDAVMALLPEGGCFVFSLNDHALEDPTFAAGVAALVGTKTAAIAFKEYGPHLPGRDLRAVVYVLRKLAA